MKLPVPALVIVLFFSSCTSFQYLTVNSPALPYAGKQFISGKDSLEVRYQFDGYKAVLLLDIKNNSSQPVTIDWKRSAVITNGITLSLFNRVMPITASAAYDTLQNTPAVRSATVNGNITVPGETDFIPPFSTLQKKTMQSISQPFNVTFNYDDALVKETSLKQKIKIPGKAFTAENTPCKIRVYITYTAGNSQNLFIENDFFVSEIFETAKAPSTIEELFGKSQPVVYTY